jgi:hypothetical protein
MKHNVVNLGLFLEGSLLKRKLHDVVGSAGVVRTERLVNSFIFLFFSQLDLVVIYVSWISNYEVIIIVLL